MTRRQRLRLGVLGQHQFAYDDQDILSVALQGDPERWAALVEHGRWRIRQRRR